MKEYYLPKGMRCASLREREQFYKDEFKLGKVEEWFKPIAGRIAFAVIIGSHTGIYPEKYKEEASTTIIIDEYQTLQDVKSYMLEFLPESVYYDRNIYDGNNKIVSQELAFDLDPENVTCPVHGSLADKMQQGQGLSFCELELQMVKDYTLGLYEYLRRRFSSMTVVYSGRGYHIHVFDKDAYEMNRKSRRQLAEEVKSKGFPIDEWVTAGEMRFIRLPYSLHGLVSRIVIPVDSKELGDFDPVKDARCVPRFL